MYAEATYDDVVADVRRELCRRVDAALAAGVAAERLVVDPGLGFGKQPEHDLALLAGLHRITGLGFPVLIGASRKRFLGAVLAASDGRPGHPRARPRHRRDLGSRCAGGRVGVRVHDVAGSADALRVVAAVAPGDRAHPRERRPLRLWRPSVGRRNTRTHGHTER